MGSNRKEVNDDSSALSVINWKNGIVLMDGEDWAKLVLRQKVGGRETQGLGF